MVVPAYNEEELIENTMDSIPDYVDMVFVVNDGSTDRTEELISAHAQKDSRFILIDKENGGVGSAIVAGYKKAIAAGMDISAVMAGDNQMDSQYLSSLLDPIVDGDAHYSKGNRLTSNHSAKGMSPWRYFGNNLLTMLTKISSGLWDIQDPQNGYTAIDNSVFKKLDPDEIFTWYGYCNDMLTRLNMYGFRVVDVPIPARYGNEKSKIKYPEYMYKVSRLLLIDFIMRISYKQKGKSALRFVTLSFLAIAISFIGIVMAIEFQSYDYELFQAVFFGLFAFALTVTVLLAFYLFLLVCGAVLIHKGKPKICM